MALALLFIALIAGFCVACRNGRRDYVRSLEGRERYPPLQGGE